MRWQIRSKRYLVVAVLLGSISAHSQTGRTVGNAHVGKGYALVQNNQFAEAASEFRAALAVDPETLGIAYGENGKYEAAIEPLKRAAQLDPDSFEILHNRAGFCAQIEPRGWGYIRAVVSRFCDPRQSRSATSH
jgi:tetratricopeptide (TPR) repeat protein